MTWAEVPVLAAEQTATSGPNWGLVAFGLLFVAISATNAINPKLQWKMSKWSLKNPAASEPSDLGLKVTRIVSSVLVVVGIGIVIFALTR